MAVSCPVCGKSSHDAEFCDYCNADLQTGTAERVPLRCPVPNHAVVSIPERKAASLSRPESYIVLRGKNQSWRAHWISRSAWSHWQDIFERRRQVVCPALPPVHVIEDEAGNWVLAEHDGGSPNWHTDDVTENGDPLGLCKQVLAATRRMAEVMASLHAADLIWLNFNPLELEQADDGDTLRITNCDLRVFAPGPCPDRVATRPSFAAPETIGFYPHDVGPWTDTFHVALFTYYWLANLLPGGFTGNGLQAFDYKFPPLRTFNPDLPPGLMNVIQKALSVSPSSRYPEPASFVDAFRVAVECAIQRYRSNGAVTWEIGRHTETGRAKRALQRENEDAVLVKQFDHPERALVSVTDGVTTCYVGSGALASFLTCETLDHQFDATRKAPDFEETIQRTCRKASENILQWALQHGYRDQLREGVDLMGTTLCAGWLENRQLTLANVGDSRAYLITDDFVEQLTVDGDMAGEMFLSGIPPEEVRQMGVMSRALRDCVGGCAVTDDGGLRPLNAHRPQISRWQLLPGDAIVICSDGLVDEGVFLEPDYLADFVRTHRNQSAQEVAEGLTSAADQLQRLPSAMEPDGFGDNIACVLIRIRENEKADADQASGEVHPRLIQSE